MSYKVLFHSAVGGLGKSTAIVGLAKMLRDEQKKSVVIIDLDVSSPNISNILRREGQLAKNGMADCLAGYRKIENMKIDFKDITFFPMYGKELKMSDYIEKVREDGFCNINGVIKDIEDKYKPDVILIDSPSGVSQFSTSCLRDLNYDNVFLFSSLNEYSTDAYKELFEILKDEDKTIEIRDKTKIVLSGLHLDRAEEKDFRDFTETWWDIYLDNCYEEVLAYEGYSFDCNDEDAPHYPLILHKRDRFCIDEILNISNFKKNRDGFLEQLIEKHEEKIKEYNLKEKKDIRGISTQDSRRKKHCFNERKSYRESLKEDSEKYDKQALLLTYCNLYDFTVNDIESVENYKQECRKNKMQEQSFASQATL